LPAVHALIGCPKMHFELHIWQTAGHSLPRIHRRIMGSAITI
jgi:hypothetical protein